MFEGEAEFAVVIGKKASNVKAKDAMKYVFGYTNFIDGSARGVVPPTNVFYQMKSRDTFAPIGPYIVTADEIKDPHKLPIVLTNNGTVMQKFNSDDMAHKIPRCIEWVTSIHTLLPGDILATGTNHRGLNPFMDGDKIELTTEGLGTLAHQGEGQAQAHLGAHHPPQAQGKRRAGRAHAADRRQVRAGAEVAGSKRRGPATCRPRSATSGGTMISKPLLLGAVVAAAAFGVAGAGAIVRRHPRRDRAGT